VENIISDVADAEYIDQFPTFSMRKLQAVYSEWTKHNLLPNNDLANSKLTLLDMADNWLAESA
jgi:hypothetical protein